MARSHLVLFVLDASVLIDYCAVDRSILTLISEEIAEVRVPTPILDEVEDLSESDCDSLGVKVVVPTNEQLLTASARRAGLSFEDHLCVVMAKDGGWTCVTSDRRLRRECEADGIAVLWGLEPLAQLAERDALSDAEAEEIAEQIQGINPFITEEILESFRERLRLQRSKKEPDDDTT